MDIGFSDLIIFIVLYLLHCTPRSFSYPRMGKSYWMESTAPTNSTLVDDLVTSFCFDDLQMIEESPILKTVPVWLLAS